MSTKSNTELEQIFENKSDYTDEAVQAVIWELENRNLIEKTDISYLETQVNSEIAETSVPKEDLENNESPFEELVLPILYSKKAIQGFSILFSTIFGVVLLMSNLKAMNKPKARVEVLVFGIAYSIFTVILLNYLPKMFFITLLFNIIGYAVLTEYYWNRNLGKHLQHRKKEIWKPLIISISIIVLLVFLQFSPQILGV
ncbi:hypothetical protein [Polaribacter sp. SA4-12]|uniref:hypothetical protein n=1 Tax=Polaribacter sp. SA4-12 TaxID=1312072 RepID=UPI001E36C32F|nr:hypothetical protein [Polaribacter sp. SA4-12]